jgi:hypothetical protein
MSSIGINPVSALAGIPGKAALQFGTFVLDAVQDSIVAFAGGGQANATQITGQIAKVITVATSGDSVSLPEARPGIDMLLLNRGANPMQVFGNGTDTIDGIAAATGISQMQNSVILYICITQGKWETEGSATGFGASGLQTMSIIDGLTAAHTNAGQGVGPIFTRMLNRIATCANTNDSANLPASFSGAMITVVNAGAQTAAIFPAAGEQINALGANNAFALAAAKVAQFYCLTVGQWHTILTA